MGGQERNRQQIHHISWLPRLEHLHFECHAIHDNMQQTPGGVRGVWGAQHCGNHMLSPAGLHRQQAQHVMTALLYSPQAA